MATGYIRISNEPFRVEIQTVNINSLAGYGLREALIQHYETIAAHRAQRRAELAAYRTRQGKIAQREAERGNLFVLLDATQRQPTV